MRDIIVTLAVFGSLPFILKRPWVGILVWTWLSLMNPHRMAWGFSTSMPFAAIVAATTLGAFMFSREKKQIPWERETVVLAMFLGWMLITTYFSFYPELAWVQFDKVVKIQLMIFVSMMLLTTSERLKYFVWANALSLAFYGVKGGIFTISKGGVHRVQGPPGTFIEGNNELGLALAITVPLLYYLAQSARHRWLRPAMYAATVLTAIAAIGTQSRGAMVAMAVMGLMFWLKSRQKFMVAFLGIVSVSLIVLIMPAEWYERMNTINTYDEDQSAMGRINAWWTAFHLASNRLFGGGFETFQQPIFALYAPNPDDFRDVHSIYFEVLGEHGFPGLALFLTLMIFSWRSASTVIKTLKHIPEYAWMRDLAAMLQVSLIAYLTAGAFLGMAYFDLPYNIVVMIVMMKVILRREGVLVGAKGPPLNPVPNAVAKRDAGMRPAQ